MSELSKTIINGLCGCWIPRGYDGNPHCNGTKEQEWCKCNGDPHNCDFYEEVRQRALTQDKQIKNQSVNYMDSNKVIKKNESVNGVVYEPFQWVPYHIDQPKDNGSVQNFLVCIKGHSVSNGEWIIKTALFGNKFELTKREQEKLLYWARVSPPKNLVDKAEAVKRLQACGILNEDGELNDAYKDILVKVEEK